ncbi:MAG: dTMP kinase [Candidatus Aenigmatarchaeota archaeon]
MKGKFIVIEGIDGAGCGTQTEILKEKLNAKLSKPVLHIRYPNYNNPIGETIHKFLHEELMLSADMQFFIYSLDMLKDMREIKNALSEGRIVLADRYFTSTLAYQCAQGFPLEKALKFAELFDFVKPDLIIYLKVSPEIAFKRKQKEKTSLDFFEKNLEFIKLVAKKYEELASKDVFGKWIVVNGEKSIEEVSKEIEKIIRI